MNFVSICLDLCNKIPLTGCLKQQQFIFTILEARKSKIKMWVPGEGSLPGLRERERTCAR